jgi:hydroxyacylglutathione hydrolase
MKVEQIYTGCLAEAAYYIQSNGEAAIIDPLRETEPYIERAKKDNAKIKYIFLTHFHADFVSGQVDLAYKTGATIVFGPTASTEYKIHVAKDNEEFSIGKLTLKTLHTPGHTLESACYLLLDEHKKEQCVFTGDTLFIGDVGRPDLAVKQGDLTEEDLARKLYQSLRTRIMTLPEDITVYPGHGAGSACGKKMSKETFDTLAHQKETNYALRSDLSEDEFVKEVLTGLSAPPQYFPKNVHMNKRVNSTIDEILKRGTRPLTVNEFKALAQSDALMLDVRHQDEFVLEHIPGSIFIGLDGQFAPWVGALIRDIDQKIVLIAPQGREREAVMRLSRIGYDHSVGYLDGGIKAWKEAGNEVDSIKKITAKELEAEMQKGQVNVLDVRRKGEWEAEHIVDVPNSPLDSINSDMATFDPDKTYYVHCAGGYRSVIFESILKSRGIHNLIDVAGGYGSIKADTTLKHTAFVCPSTI